MALKGCRCRCCRNVIDMDEVQRALDDFAKPIPPHEQAWLEQALREALVKVQSQNGSEKL